jgi:hypothetical protein
MKSNFLRPGLVAILFFACTFASAQAKFDVDAREAATELLRSSVGKWETTAEFFNPNGTVAGAFAGTTELAWLTPGKVISGKSEYPQLKLVTGLMVYINEAKGQVEMASVGGDGNLLVVSGPLGSAELRSEPVRFSDTVVGRLKFTRLNVTANSFDTRTEISDDGGKTWKMMNRQKFKRAG